MADDGWQELPLRHIVAGSLYKISLIGSLAFWGAFGLVVGIAALFGAETAHWNDKPVTGIFGLLIGLIVGAILGLVSAGFLGVSTHMGVRLYCRIRPKTKVAFSAR